MIPKGLITQIGMIVVAVGIFVTYVQPALNRVRVNQDEIAVMRTEREKVALVNNTLASLVARAENIEPTQYQKLLTYLPREIDVVTVQRDVLAIAEEAGIELTDLSALKDKNGVAPESVSSDPTLATLQRHAFTVGFTDTYDNIKRFFTLVERNHYPLHVAELKFATLGQGSGEEANRVANELPVSITLETFALDLSTSSSRGD